MHPSSRQALIEHLAHLVQHGGSLSMLFMTVATTSDGLIADLRHDQIRLCYLKAGWLDFQRTTRFKSFCREKGLPYVRERWGTEIAYPAVLGGDSVIAADHIDACILHLYGHSGPYRIEFRGVGWTPSKAG